MANPIVEHVRYVSTGPETSVNASFVQYPKSGDVIYVVHVYTGTDYHVAAPSSPWIDTGRARANSAGRYVQTSMRICTGLSTERTVSLSSGATAVIHDVEIYLLRGVDTAQLPLSSTGISGQVATNSVSFSASAPAVGDQFVISAIVLSGNSLPDSYSAGWGADAHNDTRGVHVMTKMTASGQTANAGITFSGTSRMWGGVMVGLKVAPLFISRRVREGDVWVEVHPKLSSENDLYEQIGGRVVRKDSEWIA